MMHISKEEYDRLKRIEKAGAECVAYLNVSKYMETIGSGSQLHRDLEEALEPVEPEFVEDYLYWYKYGDSSTTYMKFYNAGDEKKSQITHLTAQDWINIGAPVNITQEIAQEAMNACAELVLHTNADLAWEVGKKVLSIRNSQ